MNKYKIKGTNLKINGIEYPEGSVVELSDTHVAECLPYLEPVVGVIPSTSAPAPVAPPDGTGTTESSTKKKEAK